MSEYIERERAKAYLIGDYAYAAAKVLDEVPAADVVEVVRCKDCKHRDKSGLCQAEGQKLTIAKDNHFCGKGERRAVE